MLVDPSTPAVGSTVTGAIRQASAATGTSFNYLLATARVESGLNPQAGASTSSARGLFQFIDQTWLGTMKQSGAELGYGRYAAAITQTASGHYQVTDPEMRKEILALRNDPTANATMAGAFTRANADVLSKKLGRAPSEGELYIAHFLGAGGAARLISLASSDPNAKATQYFPNAATANSSIFFDRSTGTARTMAQVRNVLTARYDVASRGGAADPVQTAQLTASAASTKVAAPDTAGITSAFAAATPAQATESSSSVAVPAAAVAMHQNQMFHGLFQDTDRIAPVAAVVSQLWTTPLVPLEGGSGQDSRQGDLHNLFSDTEQRS
jgi:Transglycosylase SLT domain